MTQSTEPSPDTRFEQLKEFMLEWYGVPEKNAGAIIGVTKEGNPIALICQDPPAQPGNNTLTQDRLDEIIKNAQRIRGNTPVHVWAAGTSIPKDQEVYLLHRITV